MQLKYFLDSTILDKFEINFGIGDAGTGKTYLAVAAAVEALLNEKVQKIILNECEVSTSKFHLFIASSS